MSANRRTPTVVHLVPSYFGLDDGRLGGAERYAFELSRHMAKHVPTKLVSFGPRPKQMEVDGLSVRLHKPLAYVRNLESNPFSLKVFGELLDADIIHCHQKHVVVSSLAALFSRLSRKKVWVTDHGGGGWDFSQYVSTDPWFNGELHVSRFSLSVNGNKIGDKQHVIMGGVDTEKFSPAPGERTHALYVGRILPHKGVHDLIAGIDADVPLEVVGPVLDPVYFRALQKLADGKQVRFHTEVDDEKLVEVYRRAKVIVLPSAHRDFYGRETKVPELLGQTLLEGMACGAPALASRVASLPEIVKDGRNGFLVSPNSPRELGERIRWLFSHPEEAKSLGESARQSVLDHFGWDGVVRRCLEIYGHPIVTS